MSASDLVARLREEGVSRAKLGGVDIDGVVRGKYISLDKLESALTKGFGFCDVIFGWDIEDRLYDNAAVTGWNTGFPDALAIIDPDTLRRLPWEPGVVAFLCDFRLPSGKAHPACPRSLLRSVLRRLEKAGFEAQMGVEFEFFFFKEDRDSLREKGFRALKPLDSGMFGYSWLRTGQDAELVADIWTTCEAFGVALEGLHTETGAGVYEAAIAHNTALAAADQAVLFKTVVRQVAARHGISVTFMAKVHEDLPGSSGHIHQSLWAQGKNVFYDGRARHGMSALMRAFVAGQHALLGDWTALYNPTINSYRRFVPGLWAPLVASWGVENRTCSLRIVGPGSASALRVELRQTAADINPYIAMAAALASGLYGIEQGLELPPETTGDAGEGGAWAVPLSLAEATARLASSGPARRCLGKSFVEHYVTTRQWEVRQAQRAVTDWERQRYFENI